MEGQYNLRSPAVKRLMREAKELHTATSMYHAQPLEDNLFEWHFTVQGPKDTAFAGGRYHGRIILPPDYPMKPPSIIMLTVKYINYLSASYVSLDTASMPNGRFEVNRKICLSMSAYHPELWQPSWSIRTALLAIIGFMPSEGGGAIGSLDYTAEERKLLAKRSIEWVCSSCGAVVKDVLVEEKDDEQSKKMTTEAADVAAQMSFKSEEETKKAIEELKQKVTEMSVSNSTEQEQSTEQDKVENIDGDNRQTETMIPAASTPSSDGLRRRNIKGANSSSQQDSRTSNRPARNDGNNITSLLVLWALIFVIVMLALRRLLFM